MKSDKYNVINELKVTADPPAAVPAENPVKLSFDEPDGIATLAHWDVYDFCEKEDPVPAGALRACRGCGQHRALFRYRGRIQHQKQHDLCLRCWRSATNRLAAAQLLARS